MSQSPADSDHTTPKSDCGDNSQSKWINIDIPSRRLSTSEVLPRKRKRYTILVTGCSGRGKSTFCNFLFKEKRFKTQGVGWGGSMSSTNKVQHGTIGDRETGVELMIIDTPGYLATHLRTDKNEDFTSEDDEMVLTEFSNALMCAKEGIDAIFVTLKAGDQVSLEEQFLMNFIDSLRLWEHCILLFTHGSRVGDNDDVRYMDFHRQIKTEAFQKNCPILVKMLEKTKNRFVIVESLNHNRDIEYYDSKLDEICKAVDLLSDVGVVFNHPMLKLARNAHDMHRNLKREEEDKIRVTTKLREDLNSKEAELERMRQLLMQKEDELARAEKQVLQGYQDEDEFKTELAHKHAEAEQDRQRMQQLVTHLEAHRSQRPNPDDPIHHLVKYLKRLDEDPKKFVDMYTHVEMLAEEQRRVNRRNEDCTEIETGMLRFRDLNEAHKRHKCTVL